MLLEELLKAGMQNISGTHHYCVDHIFQLTAIIAFSGNASLENYDEDTSVGCLKKARNLVSHINSSSKANEKLKTVRRK